MSRTESYKDHMFTVDDADARIRSAADLMQFEKFVAGDLLPPGEQIGNFKHIPRGTQVKVDDVKLVQTGSRDRRSSLARCQRTASRHSVGRRPPISAVNSSMRRSARWNRTLAPTSSARMPRGKRASS